MERLKKRRILDLPQNYFDHFCTIALRPNIRKFDRAEIVSPVFVSTSFGK